MSPSNGTTSHEPNAYVKPSTRLRQLLAKDDFCLSAPGVYDGISARLAIEAGFNCLYQSGAVTTASRLGLADLGFAGLSDFADNGRMIAGLDHTVPLIADADTGFGGPAAIARTVVEYDRAGIAAFHIEDQIQMKRCGHLNGKIIVSQEEFVTRIRAAAAARAGIPGGSDIVIISRTDALQSYGFDDSIKRLLAAREAGADVAFLEGVSTEDEIIKCVKAVAPMPVLVNLVPNGATPHWSVDECKKMGAKLVIYPFATCGPAIHAIREGLNIIKQTGKDDLQSQGMSPKAFFNIMGMEKAIAIDRAAGGAHFKTDA